MFAGVCATIGVAALNSQTWCDVTSQTPLEQPSPEDRRRLVEELLSRHAAGGDGASQALQALWREIYAEVHRLARSMLSREGSRKPIETTVLVH
jgi:hypothetical protein